MSGPLSTGQSVVAIAADQAVTAISTKQEIITAAAVENVSPLRLPAMMPLTDKTGGEHHRLAVLGHEALDLMSIEVIDDPERAGRQDDHQIIAIPSGVGEECR